MLTQLELVVYIGYLFPSSGIDTCWSIKTEKENYFARIEVLESRLEYANPCSLADYVQVRDGTDFKLFIQHRFIYRMSSSPNLPKLPDRLKICKQEYARDIFIPNMKFLCT